MADQSDPRFAKNERGDVVLIRGADPTVLGPVESVREEMCRFLSGTYFGECGPAA